MEKKQELNLHGKVKSFSTSDKKNIKTMFREGTLLKKNLCKKCKKYLKKNLLNEYLKNRGGLEGAYNTIREMICNDCKEKLK